MKEGESSERALRIEQSREKALETQVGGAMPCRGLFKGLRERIVSPESVHTFRFVKTDKIPNM